MRHALLLLALTTGCTSFDSLDRGVCGNGLIEPGEDCDSSDASCVRCAATCEAATDCPSPAYACGTDGLCHAPGGVLAPPAGAGPFQVNDLAITDLGNDGTGDVVGLSRTSIVVREGDPSGLLSRGVSIVTPFQTGRPAFGDLDGDGSLDITMSTPDGLVTYASPLGALTPMPVSSALSDTGGTGFDLVGLYRISNEALGAFISTPDGNVFVAAFDLLVPDTNDVVVLPCGANFKASVFDDTTIDVNRLSADGANPAEVILTLSGQTLAGTPRVCVLSVTKARGAKAVMTDITPVAAANVAGHAITADVDFDLDTCPALLVTTATGLRQFDGSRSGGTCGLAAGSAPITLGDATPGATLVGKLPLTPGIALVANDMLVMSDGVYANFVGTYAKVYASTRKIARVDAGDLNGDGRVDGVVASQGEDDIDILYRTEQPGYQLVRLDTASRVTSLTVGDYDGNGVGDIAYTELIDAYQRLEVAYCTTDRPLEPVAMGAFPADISVVRLAIPDTVDQQSLAADLAVLTLRTGARPSTVTFFHGSPQRTMMPYYDPTPDPLPGVSQRPYPLRGAVVGNFDGDTLRDVAGVGIATAANAATPVRAWLMKGTPTGPDGTPGPGKPVTGLTSCPRASADLCAEDAMYVAFAGASHDLVLAIDRSDPPRAAVIDPTSTTAALAATPAALTTGLPAGSVVRSAYAVDLDGDAVPELVAAFSPRVGTAGPGAIRRCAFDGGTVSGCADLTADILAAVDGAAACIDAAPGRFGYQDAFSTQRGVVDLVVLCRGAGVSMIERVSAGPAGLTIVELARVPEVLEAIRVGDVTGDGVDDIAAIAVDHGSETLEVLRQCSSRDAAACTGGGQ